MKKLAVIALLACGSFLGGCATPAYSTKERGQMIARNWGYEYKQIADDIDHALLLRPASHLTIWNIR